MKKRFVAVFICMVALAAQSSLGAVSAYSPQGSRSSGNISANSISGWTNRSGKLETVLGASGNVSYKGASLWAIPELDKAAEYGLITDRIRDNIVANITREEFAEIAVKLYEIYTGNKAETGNESFTDTTNPEILKAANLKITGGIGGGKFGPKQLVTREQIATFLIRTLKAMDPAEDYSASGSSKFSDDNLIDSWAQEGVYYCSGVGIIKGIQNQNGSFRFDPDGNSSREVAVIVCTRAYESFIKNTGSQPTPQPTLQPTPVEEPANKEDPSTETWNGNIIIIDFQFKPDQYVISEINGDSFIFIPYQQFGTLFKMPAKSDYGLFPQVYMKEETIIVNYRDDKGETAMNITMEVGSSTAYLNGGPIDIFAGPYRDGDILYVPVNLFLELFEMQNVMFQGRLCFEYPKDFPQTILEGSWSTSSVSLFTSYQNITTGAISMPSYEKSYSFNTDGTYRLAYASCGGFMDTFLMQNGKYKVIGNVIIFYDQYETLYQGSPLTKIYEKRHMGERMEMNFIDDYNEETDKIRLDMTYFTRSQGE